VVVDTDAPLASQAAVDATISPAAAIDTLRVDVLWDHLELPQTQTFSVAEVIDWPVSFGIAAPEAGGTVRFRLRAFQTAFATTEVAGGIRELVPFEGASIDRLVTVPFPAEGSSRVRVVLAFSCIGARPSFGESGTTCVDAGRAVASPAEGVEDIGDAAVATVAGSTPLAREVPCSGARETAVCVPGGFGFLGHPDIWGLPEISQLDARPLRPVVVRPFALDRVEFSVQRYRDLWNAGKLEEQPQAFGPDPDHFCTWLGPGDDANDALPVNCITPAIADAACLADGGTLPSEAQWEHAARGRGRGWVYPWGDALPPCCAASVARFSPFQGLPPICGTVEGPEPIASHLPSPDCGGLGDQSLDGVVDLGGSVTEYLRDELDAYDAPCWSTDQGILHDPICLDGTGDGRAARGGAWTTERGFCIAAARRAALGYSAGSGFRCAYEVSP
jgi:formylglycine-generating enzyme required for sulfatase activity